jgi:hypothetical protein
LSSTDPSTTQPSRKIPSPSPLYPPCPVQTQANRKTTISDYAAKVFGFQTFGKVYGLIICLAGLFNFSQSAFDVLTHKVFANDPRPVNLILLGLVVVVGVALVGFVASRRKALKRELLGMEAEGANETLMPGRLEEANGNGRRYGTNG